MTDAPRPEQRWRPRFSLRTLLILVLLFASVGGLWWRWEPWGLVYSRNFGDEWAHIYIPPNETEPLYAVRYARPNMEVFNVRTNTKLLSVPVFHLIGIVCDGRALLGRTNAGVELYDLSSASQIHTWEKSNVSEFVFEFVVASDQRTLVSFSGKDTKSGFLRNGPIDAWDLKSGAKTLHFQNQSRLSDVAFSPDGKFLAVTSYDTPGTFDVTTINLVSAQVESKRSLNNAVWPTGSVALAPKCDIATTDMYRVSVWDKSGAVKWTWNFTSTNSPADVAHGSLKYFSDGKRLFANIDGTKSAILDAVTGEPLYISRDGISGEICGNDVIVNSERGRVRIWQRRRPERWWGLAWLPEFWLTVFLSSALIWSVRRDQPHAKNTLSHP